MGLVHVELANVCQFQNTRQLQKHSAAHIRNIVVLEKHYKEIEFVPQYTEEELQTGNDH